MPIIQSLLDTDFYKFTMGHWVFKRYPNVPVRYAFKNRTARVQLAEYIDAAELRRELDAVLARAAAAGVGPMLTISTRVRRFAELQEIVDAHDNVFYVREVDTANSRLVDVMIYQPTDRAFPRMITARSGRFTENVWHLEDVVTREIGPDGFVDREVTPRFPDGLTLFAGAGQWRGADGTIVKEGSRVLVLLHPDTPEVERNLAAIRNAYVAQFAQESVLRVDGASCVSF